MDANMDRNLKQFGERNILSPILEDSSETINHEKPDIEQVIQIIHFITSHFNDPQFEIDVLEAIRLANLALKIVGNELERDYSDLLDQTQRSFRDACKNRNLNIVARLQLLEILELRSLSWISNARLENFYKQKYFQLKQEHNIYAKNITEPITNLNGKIERYTALLCAQGKILPAVSIKTSSSFKAADNINPGPKIKSQNQSAAVEYTCGSIATSSSQEENKIFSEVSTVLKKLYIGQSIYDLDNKAIMDAESSINPLMLVDYVFEHLAKVSKEAHAVYTSRECDQEKAYILFKTFLLIYKDLRKTKEFKELEPKDNIVKKDAYFAHIALDMIRPQLEKRYLEHQKSQVYAQANRLASRLTLNSSPIDTKDREGNTPILASGNHNQSSNSHSQSPRRYSSKVRYTPDKCYQCGNYEFVINVGERGYVMLQGKDLQTTKAARYVLQNFIKWGMTKQIGNKITAQKEKEILKKEEKPEKSSSQIKAYDRKTLLLISKPPFCESISKGNMILDPDSPTVFPDYVQSIFKPELRSNSEAAATAKVVKTIRATVETWDEAANKWVQISNKKP